MNSRGIAAELAQASTEHLGWIVNQIDTVSATQAEPWTAGGEAVLCSYLGGHRTARTLTIELGCRSQMEDLVHSAHQGLACEAARRGLSVTAADERAIEIGFQDKAWVRIEQWRSRIRSPGRKMELGGHVIAVREREQVLEKLLHVTDVVPDKDWKREDAIRLLDLGTAARLCPDAWRAAWNVLEVEDQRRIMNRIRDPKTRREYDRQTLISTLEGLQPEIARPDGDALVAGLELAMRHHRIFDAELVDGEWIGYRMDELGCVVEERIGTIVDARQRGWGTLIERYADASREPAERWLRKMLDTRCIPELAPGATQRVVEAVERMRRACVRATGSTVIPRGPQYRSGTLPEADDDVAARIRSAWQEAGDG